MSTITEWVDPSSFGFRSLKFYTIDINVLCCSLVSPYVYVGTEHKVLKDLNESFFL